MDSYMRIMLSILLLSALFALGRWVNKMDRFKHLVHKRDDK
jgi:hypothetical protein